ncbi:MAG: nickel-dependent lactate racemase [Candidatus Latescibacteria bacterium]|nr:nickel-dependent lactate racemase [Candidatus Latescibacterota bacterium]
MKLCLDYGKDGLWVDIPDRNLKAILDLNPTPPLDDPVGAVEEGLASPIGAPRLADFARERSSACIVISDITRPVPNTLLLPPILRVLEENGIRRERITILVGTGLHRPNTTEELISMVGPMIVEGYRIVNHVAREIETVTYLGETSMGLPIYVNSSYFAADLKIVTGLIEPHLMAGYSGGRKAICPGISGAETIKRFHGFRILSSPLATEGVIEGNPVHQQSLEVAVSAGVDFLVNVVIDRERRVTGVFCGDVERAHEAGIRFTEQQAKATVSQPVDVVVTTSAGYPLDLTFYQAIKGLTAAMPVVRAGGTIILAAQCAEGVGGREFSDLLTNVSGPEEFLCMGEEADFFALDQWQLQELCKVLRKAHVLLYSDVEIGDRFVSRVESVEGGVERVHREYGRDVEIAVIPKGPYVLARVQNGEVRG